MSSVDRDGVGRSPNARPEAGIGQGTAIPGGRVGEDPASMTPETQTRPAIVRMQVLGGNSAAAVVGAGPLPRKVNFFLGNDPSQWHTNIATDPTGEYQNAYPGTDLEYYGTQGQLGYEFVVGA